MKSNNLFSIDYYVDTINLVHDHGHKFVMLDELIRCREDPYPNAFIEDKHGKLFFKKVEFLANE